MKKIIALVLALVSLVALTACGGNTEATTAKTTTNAATTVASTKGAEVKVMSYAEYLAAQVDDPIVIETYVQAKQSWWNNKATIYTQDQDGAYFIYEMVCTEEEYASLVPGTKIRVTGFRTEWAGEVEVASGATFEIINDAAPYVATALDVTEYLGTEALINYQNQFVSLKGLEVVAQKGSDAAFAYKNAENKTDDLYYSVKLRDTTFDFCVEFYLCGQDTDVYKAVEGLKVGDIVNVEGFLYWYNGVNLHTTSLTLAQPE